MNTDTNANTLTPEQENKAKWHEMVTAERHRLYSTKTNTNIKTNTNMNKKTMQNATAYEVVLSQNSDIAIIEYLRSELNAYFTVEYDASTNYTIQLHNVVTITRVDQHSYIILMQHKVIHECELGKDQDEMTLDTNKLKAFLALIDVYYEIAQKLTE